MYALAEPLDVETGEAVLKYFAPMIGADPVATDWTRLFRLAAVVRGGTNTWEEEYYHADLCDERSLITTEMLPKVDAVPTRTALRPVVIGNEPEPEEPRKISNEQWEKFHHRLQNRKCEAAVFFGEPLGETGERMQNVHSYVGEICTTLANMPECDPETIYSLLYQAAAQLDTDTDTPSWTAEIWKAAQKWWAIEQAKLPKQKGPEEKKELLTGLNQRVKGVQEWYPDLPDQETDLAAAQYWVISHQLLIDSQRFYVMDEDGWYDQLALTDRQLIPYIKRRGLDDQIGVQVPLEKGGFRDKRLSELLTEYGSPIAKRVGVVSRESNRLLYPDTSNATLEFGLFARRDIEPVYNEEINHWIELLGGERADELKQWIAWSLAFEEGPICALALIGTMGSGKHMLTQGLAECINTQTYIDQKQFRGEFNEGLIHSPFVVVDEALHSSVKKDFPDSFRTMVAGADTDINAKFQSPFKIKNPPRFMFTTNDDRVLTDIGGARALSIEERAALMIRMIYLPVGPAAAAWLKEIGGYKHTGGWITYAGGRPGRDIVAKHCLWMYENRELLVVRPGERFLMDGGYDPELERFWGTGSGSNPEVVHTILIMLERKTGAPISGLEVKDSEVYVTAHAIAESHDSFSRGKGGIAPLSVRAIGFALRSLSQAGGYGVQRRISGDKRRWHNLDLDKLLQEAEEFGYPHARLLEIMGKREPRKKGQADVIDIKDRVG